MPYCYFNFSGMNFCLFIKMSPLEIALYLYFFIGKVIFLGFILYALEIDLTIWNSILLQKKYLTFHKYILGECTTCYPFQKESFLFLHLRAQNTIVLVLQIEQDSHNIKTTSICLFSLFRIQDVCQIIISISVRRIFNYSIIEMSLLKIALYLHFFIGKVIFLVFIVYALEKDLTIWNSILLQKKYLSFHKYILGECTTCYPFQKEAFLFLHSSHEIPF